MHFPPGPDGAHELRNDTDAPVRYVMAGTRVSPEMAEYPDLGQLTAQSRHANQKGEPLFVIHTLDVRRAPTLAGLMLLANVKNRTPVGGSTPAPACATARSARRLWAAPVLRSITSTFEGAA